MPCLLRQCARALQHALRLERLLEARHWRWVGGSAVVHTAGAPLSAHCGMRACAQISTDASLREMIPPGVLVIATPLLVRHAGMHPVCGSQGRQRQDLPQHRATRQLTPYRRLWAGWCAMRGGWRGRVRPLPAVCARRGDVRVPCFGSSRSNTSRSISFGASAASIVCTTHTRAHARTRTQRFMHTHIIHTHTHTPTHKHTHTHTHTHTHNTHTIQCRSRV